MAMLSRRTVVTGLTALPLAAALPFPARAADELLIFCGITMVKPIKEIAGLVEARHGTRFTISQGGSEDLYSALKLAHQGDIYFPGAASYRQQFLGDGLLGEAVPVGYNVAALMVAKGNPKRIKADIGELLRPDLAVVVCNPETGSIGAETKRILDRAGTLDKVMARSVFLATDSRNLIQAMKNQQADLILNWRATAFFPENREIVDVIDLDPAISQPSKLELNLLTFSKNPDGARRFMALAASPEGQAIFRRHGFLDAAMRGDT
ncbi:substrate-binding domain-containing protein [Magnetospirillum sp. UT-4]|uniref:substrate-binding domain-containing protein n=1 Tax=Magnetospirillum sp. UT-4 TaxID=2681467 RepID=UPI00137DCFD0|nr:substrate-binding domain-containing protein [Magnetospirillum sp. UT-4]CAA7611684.1 putative Molybdenum ABC transporter, periplasmic molybdate-binding protein [Magnetospirillum sp. UT-4]